MRLPYVALALVVSSSVLAQQNNAVKPATPTEPVTTIIEAFRAHPIVALSEGRHGNEQAHAFRLALVRDPRFAATVNDIVVEFGTARYQEVIDRYISGADVPSSELRFAWQNTSQSQPVWDLPIYEEFFRAVREANASLSPERRLRVILGDPPIDWSQVTSFGDIIGQMREVGDRDTYPVNLIRREVLAKRRRALVIYGDMHLQRMPAASRLGPGNIVNQLEDAPDTQVFTIYTAAGGADLQTLQPDVVNWRIPSLTILRGTALGATPHRAFLPPGPLMIGRDGKPLPDSPVLAQPIEERFDALLYLGPASIITYSRLSPGLCADAAYIRMRSERMAMVAPPGKQAPPLCR